MKSLILETERKLNESKSLRDATTEVLRENEAEIAKNVMRNNSLLQRK